MRGWARLRFIALVSALAGTLGGCGAPVQRIVSTEEPGIPIIAFRDSPVVDETRTWLLSSPFGQQWGVTGRVLEVATFVDKSAITDQLTIDFQGDLGIRGNIAARGSISTVSLRSAKCDIAPFRADAARLLAETSIVTFRYKAESLRKAIHVGFIAENTPPELSGNRHDRFDVTNSAAIDMAASKALLARVRRAERTVARLQRALQRETSPERTSLRFVRPS